MNNDGRLVRTLAITNVFKILRNQSVTLKVGRQDKTKADVILIAGIGVIREQDVAFFHRNTRNAIFPRIHLHVYLIKHAVDHFRYIFFSLNVLFPRTY